MTGDDQALIDRFLDMMAAEAGASKNTLAAYRNDLGQARAVLGRELAAAGPDDVSRLGALRIVAIVGCGGSVRRRRVLECGSRSERRLSGGGTVDDSPPLTHLTPVDLHRSFHTV